MKVNKYTSTQSFGMALKIKTKDLKSLAEHMNLSDVAKLENAGKDLNGTKFYDMEIGEYGSRKITSASRQFEGDSFTVEHPRNGNLLPYNAKWAGKESVGLKPGDTFHGYIQFENSKAAQKAYMDVAQSYGIERDIKMIKYLDDNEKKGSQVFFNTNKRHMPSDNEKKEVLSRLQHLKEKYGA